MLPSWFWSIITICGQKWMKRNHFVQQNWCIKAKYLCFCFSGQWEVTVRRNAGPRCPSTSPPGPWRLIGQWEESGAPTAPPALLDGRRPPWWSYGCRWCCCGCRCPPELNKWAVGDTVGRRSMVPCRPLCPRPRPPPPPRRRPALRSSARGRARGS